MDETIYVIFKVQFDFALEVWFSIERHPLYARFYVFVVCGFFFLRIVFFFFNTIIMLNSLDPNQNRRFVAPDLGRSCLQRLSEDDKSRR